MQCDAILSKFGRRGSAIKHDNLGGPFAIFLLRASKGASGIGTASQRLTADSAAPKASVCSMKCFMTSHACLALPLPLSLLTHVTLLPNPTPIAQTGTISTTDSLSPHVSRPASEQMTIRNEGMSCALLLGSYPCY